MTVSAVPAGARGWRAALLVPTTSLAELWRNRLVLWQLIQRDLTVKYQQSVLGYLWSLLEPLGMALTYWFVFAKLYHTSVLPSGGGSYPLFIVSGIFPWMWFASAMSESTGALTSQARLIATMRFPREIFPIARVAGRFGEFVAGLPIMAAIALITGTPFTPRLLWLLPAIALQAILLIGIALLLSSVNVLLRDVERVMRLAQRVLLYAAPVIYPLRKVTENVHGWPKDLYLANPLVGIFQLQHGAWFAHEMPSATLIWTSVVGCVVIFLAGWIVFHRLERAVLKEL